MIVPVTAFSLGGTQFFLNRVEQLLADDLRTLSDLIHALDSISADISLVAEDTADAVFIIGIAAARFQSGIVKLSDDLSKGTSLGIHPEDLPDDSSLIFIYLEALVSSDMITESYVPSRAFALDNILTDTSPDLLRQLRRVILVHGFQQSFHNNALWTVRDLLHS